MRSRLPLLLQDRGVKSLMTLKGETPVSLSDIVEWFVMIAARSLTVIRQRHQICLKIRTII